MTRFLMAGICLSILATLTLARLRRDAQRWAEWDTPETDEMQQAFLDARNSATFYTNQVTGVSWSAN